MRRGQTISATKRFAKKVVIDESTGCWMWTGWKDKDGYGTFWYREQNQRAHRASYQMHVGEIPEGHQIDHTCRTPSCVNPAHLEIVTTKENTRRGLNGVLRPEFTHCKRGHPWNESNVRTDPKSGKKICRSCDRERQRERYQKKSLAQATAPAST